MARRSVILDLDGTIWDSRPWYEKLVAIRAPQELAGSNAARALRHAGWTEARFRGICRSGDPPLDCYPDVAESLVELSQRGIGIGVVTNLPTWMAGPMLCAVDLDSIVQSVIAWGTTPRRKPHPDPLLLAADRLGVKVGDAWYVGDDPDDAAAAGSAGMPFAWASWGYTSVPPDGTARVLERGFEIVNLVDGAR